MRAVLILFAAVMFGLAGGYGWSAMTPARAHVRVPKPVDATPPPIPESAADREWAERAMDKGSPVVESAAPDPVKVEQSVYYASCADARAAGHAPIRVGEPGYRSALDADGDGIACEPYSRQ